MHRGLFIILTLILIGTSCKKDNDTRFLNQNDMASLLVKVHLIDGYLNSLQIDSSRKIINSIYQQAFDEYHLDSVSFEENLRHYMSQPEKAENVYAKVKAKLSQMENILVRQDSLKHALQSDSIRRVDRWRKMANEKHQLISNVSQDTVSLTFVERGWDFFRQLSIYHIPINPIHRPIPKMMVDSVDHPISIHNKATLDTLVR